MGVPTAKTAARAAPTASIFTGLSFQDSDKPEDQNISDQGGLPQKIDDGLLRKLRMII